MVVGGERRQPENSQWAGWDHREPGPGVGTALLEKAVARGASEDAQQVAVGRGAGAEGGGGPEGTAGGVRN